MALYSDYGLHRGPLGALLLNRIDLSPGEALFLPAGILHAYVRGLGIEIMASSDNVLRGGLTQKHVDPSELGRVLSFEPYRPDVLRPKESVSSRGATVASYITDAEEFELSFIEVTLGCSFEGTGPDVLLVLSGEVIVRSSEEEVHLTSGDELFCGAGAPYEISGSGRVARASQNGAHP